MTRRALILSGGIYHPFEETSAQVASELGALGIRSEIASPRAGLEMLRAAPVDLLVVNALAFTMTQDEKYAPMRPKHAFRTEPEHRAGITAHFDQGGALLGLHTAAICFDDWADWPDLLGATWVWGISHHPPPGPVQVSGIETFNTQDELYCNLKLADGADILAIATMPGIPEPQPVLCVRNRAAYLALGHDVAACANPGFRALLRHAVETVLTATEETG